MSTTNKKYEKNAEIEEWMKQYKISRNLELRNNILVYYSYIAKSVAAQMRGIINSFAQVDDMVNHGVITLIDCIEKFEPEKGIQFESYAFFRVRGSIIDFVRKQDWVPRRVRKMSKEIKGAYDALSVEYLREPTDSEIAEYLKITETQLQKNYLEVSNGITISFEGTIGENIQQTSKENSLTDYENAPENQILKSELEIKLAEAIDTLKEQEKIVISLHYFEHLKLKEIAQILQVSESRVSQINTKVLLKLQNKLTSYVKE